MKTTKEMIEVMQAYLDGAEIQFTRRDRACSAWVTGCAAPHWDWVTFDYRVNPKEPETIYLVVNGTGLVAGSPISNKLLAERKASSLNRQWQYGRYTVRKFVEVLEDEE